MRKTLAAAAAVGVISLAVAVGMSAAAGKKVHFIDHVTGNGIGGANAAYAIHDSFFGNGAGTQVVKSKASGGSDREITYYGDATLVSRGTFSLGAPDSNGVSKLTGSGHDISGTGRAKGVTSSYTYTGTFNVKTGVFKATLKGTYRFP
jgi:hypothetical protein